jgi:hypothetical protein
MEGLLWLLGFGVLFYVMTRYFLGLAESYGHGWYFALVWAPPHNFFAARRGGRS